MAQITWRNINAPGGNPTSDLLAAGQFLNNAVANAQNIVNTQQGNISRQLDELDATNQADIQSRLSALGTSSAIQEAINTNAFDDILKNMTGTQRQTAMNNIQRQMNMFLDRELQQERTQISRDQLTETIAQNAVSNARNDRNDKFNQSLQTAQEQRQQTLFDNQIADITRAQELGKVFSAERLEAVRDKSINAVNEKFSKYMNPISGKIDLAAMSEADLLEYRKEMEAIPNITRDALLTELNTAVTQFNNPAMADIVRAREASNIQLLWNGSPNTQREINNYAKAWAKQNKAENNIYIKAAQEDPAERDRAIADALDKADLGTAERDSIMRFLGEGGVNYNGEVIPITKDAAVAMIKMSRGAKFWSFTSWKDTFRGLQNAYIEAAIGKGGTGNQLEQFMQYSNDLANYQSSKSINPAKKHEFQIQQIDAYLAWKHKAAQEKANTSPTEPNQNIFIDYPKLSR